MGAAEDLAGLRRDSARRAWERSALVRQQWAMLRGLMRSKKLDPFDAISGTLPDDIAAEAEPIIARVSCEKVLRGVRGIARKRAVDICLALGLDPSQRMESLTWEQRAELARSARIVIGRPAE